MSVLENFKKLGQLASYHFADDSGKEWDLGYKNQREAEALFIENPELREEMIQIAKGFLWTLNPDELAGV